MSSQITSTDTLPYLLDALVKESPDIPMLIDAVTDRRVTRAEFDRENRLWARRLAALGMTAGSNVATMMGEGLRVIKRTMESAVASDGNRA